MPLMAAGTGTQEYRTNLTHEKLVTQSFSGFHNPHNHSIHLKGVGRASSIMDRVILFIMEDYKHRCKKNGL